MSLSERLTHKHSSDSVPTLMTSPLAPGCCTSVNSHHHSSNETLNRFQAAREFYGVLWVLEQVPVVLGGPVGP